VAVIEVPADEFAWRSTTLLK